MACWNGNSLATSEDPQLMLRLCTKHKVDTADVTSLSRVVSENLSRKHSVLVSTFPLPTQICLLEYFLDLIVENSDYLIFLHISGFNPEFLSSLDISSSVLFEEFLDRKKTFDKFKRVYLVVHQDYYNLNNTDTLVNNNNVVFVFISNHVLSPFLMPGVKNALNLILCPEAPNSEVSPFSFTHISTDGKDVLVEMCDGRPNEIVSRIKSNKKVESLISRLGERELSQNLPRIMSDELLNSLIQKYLILDFELLENISEVVASNLLKGVSLVVERFDAELLTCLLDFLLMKLLNTRDACVLVYYVKSVYKHILKLDILRESRNFSFVPNENDFSKKILFCSGKDENQIFYKLKDIFGKSPQCYIICYSQGKYVNRSMFTFQCPFLFLTTQKMEKSVNGISRPFLLVNKDTFPSRLSLFPINGFQNLDTPANTVENDSTKATVEKDTRNTVKPETPVSEEADKIQKKCSESLTVQATNRVESFNLSSLDSARTSSLAKEFKTNPVAVEKLCSAVLHFLNEGDSIIVDNFDHDVLACLFEFVVTKKSVDSQVYYRFINLQSQNLDIVKSVNVKDVSGSKLKKLQPFNPNSLYIQFYISLHFLENIFSKIGCQVLGLARSNLSYYCNSKWISSNFVNIRCVRGEEFVINHYNIGEIPAEFEPENTQDKKELSELSAFIINKHNPVKIMINKLFTEHNILQPSFSSSDSYLCILTLLLENRSLVLEGYDVIFLTPLIRMFALESQKYDRSVYIYNGSEFYEPSIPKSKIITKEYFLQHNSVNDVTLSLFLLFFVDSKHFSEIKLHLSKHHQYVFVLSEEIASSALENSAFDFTHVSDISDSVCIREYRGSENNSLEASGPSDSIPEIEQLDRSPKLPDSDIVMSPPSTEMDSNQDIPEVPLKSIVSVDKPNETKIEENIVQLESTIGEDSLLGTEKLEDCTPSEMRDIPENEVAVDTKSAMNIELNSGSDENVENAKEVTENVKFEEIPESERIGYLQQTAEIIHRNLEMFELDPSKLEFPNSQSETKEFRGEKPINQISDDDYQSCDDDEISQSNTQLPSTNELSDSKDSHSLPNSKNEFVSQDNSIPFSENSISVPEKVSDTNLNLDLSDSSTELITSLLHSGIHLIIHSSSDLLYIPILQHVASVLNPSTLHLQVVLTSNSPQICSTLFKLLSTKLATLGHGFLYKTGQILKLKSYILEENVQILSIPLDSLVSLIQHKAVFLENSLLVYIEDNEDRDIRRLEILLKNVSKQFIFLLQNESFSLKASHFPTPFFKVKQTSQEKSKESFCVEFNSD